jgi:hypothetical protein
MMDQQVDKPVATKSQPKRKDFFFFVHSSKDRLDLDGGLNGLALLLLAVVGLGAHYTTTPVTAVLLVLVGVSLLDGGDELGELGVVLRADLGEGNNSSSLDKLE